MATLHGKGKDWHCGRLDRRDKRAHRDSVQKIPITPHRGRKPPGPLICPSVSPSSKIQAPRRGLLGPSMPKQGEQNERKTGCRQFGTDL